VFISLGFSSKLKAMTSKDPIKLFINQVKGDLETDMAKILAKELSHLELMSQLCQRIEEKLDFIYSAKFPKTCDNCGRCYDTREVYLAETTLKVAEGDDHTRGQFVEYRYCVCSAVLVVLSDDRRDHTDFGVARRQLFDLCVDKLMQAAQIEKDSGVDMVRVIFRKILSSKGG
jgi:hypothetical protein